MTNANTSGPDKAKWPEKAYKNEAFLTSPAARSIRVLCELEEPEVRFRQWGVEDTIAFFGSARALPPEAARQRLEAVIRERERAVPSERWAEAPGADLDASLEAAERAVRLSRYYGDAMALAERLTQWSKSLPHHPRRFIVCSGGGPGIMEAANRGAGKAAGVSVGLNISLPWEQQPNPYQTRELSFEFHYFFIRKFWFVFLAKALVVFPGGFGTMDELFELLTLVQTRKLQKVVPIVLYGSEFWRRVVDFDALVEWGTVCQEDLKLFRLCDDVGETFEYLKEQLTLHYL